MIVKILDVACRHKILVTLWTKNQSIKFETRIESFMVHLKRLYVQFPVTVSPSQFDEAIAQHGADLLGSFQIDTVNFFIKSKLLVKGEKSLQIEVPKEIYKLQRRANLRIPFQRKMAPKLTLYSPAKEFDPDAPIDEKDILAFRVIDVSAGGVAIATKVEDKALFTKDKMIHDIRFRIRGIEIVAQGLVKHTAEILNEQGKPILKVGIQFHALKAQYEKHIVQFVLDESRKLFSLLH